MDPDVADVIESVEGVIRFVRTQNTKLVMPLPVKQGENLETIRSNLIRDLPLETKKMKKNDYVSVISGIHIGRYGILSASKAGLFEVRPCIYMCIHKPMIYIYWPKEYNSLKYVRTLYMTGSAARSSTR